MTRFLYGDLLWKTIKSRAKRAKRTKAAIAYVTKSDALSLKPGDVLITDATDGAIASRQTSASVLSSLRKAGVALYSHSGLHAKIVVADSVLLASSANMSESSLSRLLEAGIETDNPNAVSSAVGMIEMLTKESTEIDPPFLARIKQIPVQKRYTGGKSKARVMIKGHREPITWLLGTHDIDEPTDEAELKRIETGLENAQAALSDGNSSTGWIRFSIKDRIKHARRGDNVIIIHRKKLKDEPERVYRHAPVLWIQEEPKCRRVFYEVLSNAENRSLSWAEFKKAAKLAGLPKRISKNATRQLSDKASDDLNHYWDAVRRK